LSLTEFVRALPKVELHVHLEGAMPPRTLLALAKKRRIDLPAATEPELRDWFRFRDFDHFVEIYVACSRVLQHPEDFRLLIGDFAAEQERQNVRYTEIHFTVGTHWLNDVPVDEVLDAMEEGIRAAERERGVVLRLIPDIVRDVGNRTADPTLDWAIEAGRRGVAVALGLTGREAIYPSEPYAEHFEAARRNGLHGVAHAERIGHGVRSIEDDALVERLRLSRTPLEVCPTSNVCLGVAPDVAHHAFDRLRRAGLELSVNTDDPALFDTDLSREYLLLAEAFDYGPETIVELVLGAVRHCFLPTPEKARLEASMRQEIAELAERHLGRALAG
jgi:adenosine deaminase